MADYKTRIDEATDITFIDVSGVVDMAAHMPYVRSEPFENRTLRVVADLLEASLDGMSGGTIAKMVRKVRPVSKAGMRAAYVLNRGDDYKKGKLFLAQLEVLEYEGEYKIFTETEKALEWAKQ